MIKFCRSCGSELANADDRVCATCGTGAIKGTTYCRYCGHPTTPDDAICGYCGASIKPLPGSMRSLFEYPSLSVKAGKIINLTLVAVFVITYAVFALPKSIRKPAVQAASDAVMASTGYTALPLDHIEPSPPLIPELYVYYFYYTPPGIAINSTRPFTIYAIYKNSVGENATKAIRSVDVTDNCTYRTDDDRIAVVTSPGVVLGKGPGTVNITASYTAAPGTANISNAAAGKIPVTFTTVLTVIVK